MIIKISELEKGISCVYKITFPNSKIYIGCTKDIRRRMLEHNSKSSKGEGLKKAYDEFGISEEVEILCISTDMEYLTSREAFWISKLDATNPEKGYNISLRGNAFGRKGDDNPLSKVSDAQVLDIRQRKMAGESRKNVFEDYKHLLSLKSGFDRIWSGDSHIHVAPEVIEYFANYNKSELISIANRGELAGRAKVTEDDVIKIRELYDNGLIRSEIKKIYNHMSYIQISRICKRESWKHVN